MNNEPTPRVNSALLPQYVGRVVRLTGKVIKVSGETAIVEATDGGQVEVKLTKESHMSDPYVELVGRVEDEHTLKLLADLNMGSDLDMKVINDMVETMHKFPSIYM